MEAKQGSKKKADIPKFIGIEDILRITTRGVYIGGRKLAREEIQALKADAQYLHQSFLWQMMRREIHYLAYNKASNQARNQDDINYANAMYKNLEVLEQFIKNCRGLS
jgi:hypothetical protein